MRRYTRAIFLGIFFWLIAFIIFEPVSYAAERIFYPALNEWFPSLFPEYSLVKDEEAYKAFYENLMSISAIISVFIVSYITVRFDNERLEFMITETDGMYTVVEGARLYFARYAVPDAIAAAVIPLPLSVIRVFLPEGIPEPLNVVLEHIFSLTSVFCERFGTALGALVMALAIFAARTLSALIAVSAWRGAWLSDIGT